MLFLRAQLLAVPVPRRGSGEKQKWPQQTPSVHTADSDKMGDRGLVSRLF
jgi:hypothetical protein